MSVVSCFRSGEIMITPADAIPPGVIALARGAKPACVRAVNGLARLAYDNTTWLVPGLPEAETDDAALAATRAFADRLAAALARPNDANPTED